MAESDDTKRNLLATGRGVMVLFGAAMVIAGLLTWMLISTSP